MHGVASLATRQHGLVTRLQALSAGVPSTTVDRWAHSGRLVRVQPEVFRVAGAPVTWEQEVMAAVLGAGPGAAASHRTAAKLWGLVEEAPVEVVVPICRLPRLQLVIVHRTRDPIPITHRRGIPVTTPMRALVDLGAVVPGFLVEDALDRGLVARLFTVAAVEWALAEVARPGRRGCGVLRAVLDERALAAAPPDGMLEPRFARLCKSAGLPMPEFQVRVRRRGKTYFIDFAYADLKIAIEVDGYGHRATRAAFESDTERQTALALLGWTVLRFTWTRIVRDPSGVAREIHEAIVNAQARIRA